MNKYCREIEVKIVDYSENMLDKTQREIFLAHIQDCEDCRRKFEEFTAARDILANTAQKKDLNESDKDLLFKRLTERGRRSKIMYNLAAATVAVVLILVSTFIYSTVSYKSRLQQAGQTVISSEFIIDVEEELINSDEETFEMLSSALYGDDYKEFEEILDETSIIKP